jgi:hypothetical protein
MASPGWLLIAFLLPSPILVLTSKSLFSVCRWRHLFFIIPIGPLGFLSPFIHSSLFLASSHIRFGPPGHWAALPPPPSPCGPNKQFHGIGIGIIDTWLIGRPRCRPTPIMAISFIPFPPRLLLYSIFSALFCPTFLQKPLWMPFSLKGQNDSQVNQKVNQLPFLCIRIIPNQWIHSHIPIPFHMPSFIVRRISLSFLNPLSIHDFLSSL